MLLNSMVHPQLTLYFMSQWHLSQLFTSSSTIHFVQLASRIPDSLGSFVLDSFSSQTLKIRVSHNQISVLGLFSTYFSNLRALNTMYVPTTQKSLPLENSIHVYTTAIQHFYLYVIIHSRWTPILPLKPFCPNSSAFQLVSHTQVKSLDDILEFFPIPQSHHLQILLTLPLHYVQNLTFPHHLVWVIIIISAL